jgi:hypothetical protein
MPTRVLLSFFLLTASLAAQTPWDGPAVTVSQQAGTWTIAGKKNKVTINAYDLSIKVEAGGVNWNMMPSAPGDLVVQSRGRRIPLRIAGGGQQTIEPFDAGYKKGVKISERGFQSGGLLDFFLTLTVALEGPEEELVFDSYAAEGETTVRQMDWPPPLDARDVDYTVLSNRKGTLLPRAWPKAYKPLYDEKFPQETSIIESNNVECWSMSWWGFQKGSAAMMLIVETADDAGYQFAHPAGGPTTIGPRWYATLGRFQQPRTVRMAFFAKGNYVDLAKRYRRHVMDSGQFVSLKEKIAQEPRVATLIGMPHVRVQILKNVNTKASHYDRLVAGNNYSIHTFQDRAEDLKQLKAKGVDRLAVVLAGWPKLGYDRQHPDVLPPAQAAGGWAGMADLAATLKNLGYLFLLHDQYRDYYFDAPSYKDEFAVHDEDLNGPRQTFPASRFGEQRQSDIPFLDFWEGGAQAYLNPRFMLGHLVKNYETLFSHDIKPDGSYLDVFGYVPPDQDFSFEHPASHADSMRFRAACFRWARRNLGIVGTEGGADWTIPYVDYTSSNPGKGTAIPVPLFDLVYHDALISQYGANRAEGGYLLGLLYGGAPALNTLNPTDEVLRQVRQLAKLHQRVGLLEMTNHQFLDGGTNKERTTFADGTTVTIDWAAGTATIAPDLQ